MAVGENCQQDLLGRRQREATWGDRRSETGLRCYRKQRPWYHPKVWNLSSSFLCYSFVILIVFILVGWWNRILLGSVSTFVMTHAPCPVTVVKDLSPSMHWMAALGALIYGNRRSGSYVFWISAFLFVLNPMRLNLRVSMFYYRIGYAYMLGCINAGFWWFK